MKRIRPGWDARRLARAAGLALAFLAVAPASADDGAPDVAKILDCRAGDAAAPLRWRVELLAAPPRARVDGREVAAEFGARHVRLQLGVDGGMLFIGLVSGRMVLSDATGKTVAFGLCSGPTAV